MNRWLRPVRNERGATFVFFVGMTLALLSLGALAADVGMLMTVRSEAQRAAEAAALAGAGLYMEPEAPTKDAVDAKAREYAGKNHVGHGFVSANDSSAVEVEVFEAQQRVRVTVAGTARLLFARLFGRGSMPVSAVAAARVRTAGGANCVKPWTIPDMWDERSGSDADGDNVWDEGESWTFDPADDHYERWEEPETGTMTGYGSQLRTDYTRDQGRQITIKVSDPNSEEAIQPGLFFPWDLPGDDQGGDDYRDNISTCHDSTIVLGRDYPLKPGNMIGPTFQGVQDLIEMDDRPAAEIWDEIMAGDLSSPRVIKITLFDPEEVAKSGRQYIKFNNIALLFIEKQDKSKDPIVARFIKYADGSQVGDGSLIRLLQLVE